MKSTRHLGRSIKSEGRSRWAIFGHFYFWRWWKGSRPGWSLVFIGSGFDVSVCRLVLWLNWLIWPDWSKMIKAPLTVRHGSGASAWVGRQAGVWRRWVRIRPRSGRLPMLGAGLPKTQRASGDVWKGFGGKSVGVGGGAGRELESFSEPEISKVSQAKRG